MNYEKTTLEIVQNASWCIDSNADIFFLKKTLHFSCLVVLWAVINILYLQENM